MLVLNINFSTFVYSNELWSDNGTKYDAVFEEEIFKTNRAHA